MNPAILEEARAALAMGPMPLTKLHERLKMAGSAWSESQHCLFFLAFDQFSVDRTGNEPIVCSGERSSEDRLLSEIVKVVESFAGRPVPAGEIRKRLPSDYVTTDAQVKAIVRKSDNLEVFGPGLIRNK
jgi:hypothetical protein